MSSRLRSALSLVALVLVVGAASEAWRAWSADRTGASVAALAGPGDIEMIASDTCVFCARARGWFKQHGVAFTECSIERDAACAARFNAYMAPGTPLMLVRGKPQVGFDPRRIADALGAS